MGRSEPHPAVHTLNEMGVEPTQAHFNGGREWMGQAWDVFMVLCCLSGRERIEQSTKLVRCCHGINFQGNLFRGPE